MVSRIPSEPTTSRVQPIMPIRVIAVRDLWRMTSRRFQRVPNESLWKPFVLSISRAFILLGSYGRRASAAVPWSIFLTHKKPISVRISIIATTIIMQNSGIRRRQYGISRYVPIVPFGFMIYHAIR